MHIVLHADDQLDTQKAEAIEAFRRGELDRSLLLFEAILEHWPLDQTASFYQTTIHELLDWGIAPGYLEAHWPKLETLMLEERLKRGSSPSSPPPPTHNSTPPTDFTRPHWTSSWTPSGLPPTIPIENSHKENTKTTDTSLPSELQIVLKLYQNGRRKAALLWAQSFLETHPNDPQLPTHLKALPATLQTQLARMRQATPQTQRAIDTSQISPRDSYPPIPTHTTTSLTTPTRSKRWVWLTAAALTTAALLTAALSLLP